MFYAELRLFHRPLRVTQPPKGRVPQRLASRLWMARARVNSAGGLSKFAGKTSAWSFSRCRVVLRGETATELEAYYLRTAGRVNFSANTSCGRRGLSRPTSLPARVLRRYIGVGIVVDYAEAMPAAATIARGAAGRRREPEAAMEAKLIVIGGKANKSEVVLKLPTTIGRSRSADLTVAHPKVSRQHCQIFERDGVLVVRDNESLNGTFIDNEKITEAILKPGDKLTVGPLTFVAVYEHAGSFPTLNATNQTVVQPIKPNNKIVTVDKSERTTHAARPKIGIEDVDFETPDINLRRQDLSPAAVGPAAVRRPNCRRLRRQTRPWKFPTSRAWPKRKLPPNSIFPAAAVAGRGSGSFGCGRLTGVGGGC